VRGIHATLVIAAVKNVSTIGDLPMEEFIALTMGANPTISYRQIELTVSFRENVPSPVPTLRSWIDFHVLHKPKV